MESGVERLWLVLPITKWKTYVDGNHCDGRFSYESIHSYLNCRTYPDGFSKADKLALRKRAKYFCIKGADLYYVGGSSKTDLDDKKTERLVVEDLCQRQRIVARVHDSSHFGINRSLDMVSSKHYWPGLCRDVESCEECQRKNYKLKKVSWVLHPIPIKPKIWSQVGMDLIGPLPETPRGNKFIVTLTGYFSKWVEAAPLPDKTALGVAKFIYSVMCRMGCPETLITDWDEKIDTVLMGYRSSQQSSTKHSPYFMLFQQRMRLPNDNELLKILFLLTSNFCITNICTMTALSPALTPLYQKTSQW